MPNQTMPERLLDLFQAEGVDTLFGIPDPSFFAMFLEAERRGMEIVSPHHEQAAALTADGYFRMTGKPAVLCMNKGPGVANVLAAYSAERVRNGGCGMVVIPVVTQDRARTSSSHAMGHDDIRAMVDSLRQTTRHMAEA